MGGREGHSGEGVRTSCPPTLMPYVATSTKDMNGDCEGDIDGRIKGCPNDDTDDVVRERIGGEKGRVGCSKGRGIRKRQRRNGGEECCENEKC